MEKYINNESNKKGLWYEQNFREYLKEQGEVPKNVLKLSEGVWYRGEKRCDGSVCLECIDINLSDNALTGNKEVEENDIYSVGFKLNIGDKVFFFKIEKKYIDTDGGYEEMQDTILATDIIKSLDTHNVRVVKPLLGYKDDKRSYYISEWENLPLLINVLDQYEKNNAEKYNDILNRIEQIRKLLDGYREVTSNNMFYDKNKDEIVLFDLHL